MSDVQLIQGALYEIDGEVSGWCYHAMFVLNGDYLVDTYWGTSAGQYNRGFPLWQVEGRLRLILDLNESRQALCRDEYEIYPDDQKACIPIGGGSERLLINKAAKPCLKRQREQLKHKVEQCQSDIRSAESSIRWYEQQLAELEHAEGQL